jgi:hypothetical protein
LNSIRELIEPAKFLRNAAPQKFDDFLLAFAKYTQDQFDKFLFVEGNTQLSQGHAQQCVKILKTLEEVKNGRSDR